MSGLLRVIVGATVAAWGVAPPSPANRGALGPTMRLATAWPAREGCSSYSGVDLSVDDRVNSVEWRGANGASLVFPVADPSNARGDDAYRLGSDGTDCHVGQTTCIVYRTPVGRILHVRAMRSSRGLRADFKAGAFDELILHGDLGHRPSAMSGEHHRDFGLRLFLPCLDPAKPSIAWNCDARACVTRTFRDDVKMQVFSKAEEQRPRRERRVWPPDRVPHWQRWWRGDAGKDLTALLCMRGQAGIAQAEQAARRGNGLLVCDETDANPVKRLPPAVARPMVVDLARDLLRELDMVLDEGCAGTCSARVDEIRATAGALAAATDLRPTDIRAEFHDSHDEFGYGAYPSLGFVATLRANAGSVQVVCARHRTFTSMGMPDGEDCRLTVSAHGRRLADYLPDWGPSVELPDGGAVRMLDWLPSYEPYNHARDQIVVIGSALAQTSHATQNSW